MALTPAMAFLLSEGCGNMGGGCKDILLLLPWTLWALLYGAISLGGLVAGSVAGQGRRMGGRRRDFGAPFGLAGSACRRADPGALGDPTRINAGRALVRR